MEERKPKFTKFIPLQSGPYVFEGQHTEKRNIEKQPMMQYVLNAFPNICADPKSMCSQFPLSKLCTGI